MSQAIVVKDLVKKYKSSQTRAVDDVSFEVEAGSFFAFLGPNGAGKTTTISILTTTLAKTSGKVEIAGFDLDKNQADIRQNIGVIFQKPSLDLNLTAEENIRLHAALYNLYPFRPLYSLMPKAYKDRVNELASVIGIQKQLFGKLKDFSGGMKRKMEIIRSLMHNPKVLFLDEPTSGLDAESRKGLWKYLEEVRANYGTTIFLTTHYLDEAEDADRLCIINNGKIVANDTPKSLKKKYEQNYIVIKSEDNKTLKTELDKLGASYSGNVNFKVKVDNNEVHSLLKKIKTPLIKVETHTPTLEQTYLDIIGTNEDQPGA